MSGRLTLEARPEEDGERLDVLLAARPEVGSRAAAQRLIEHGRVTVAGRVRPKRHRLAAGELVEVDLGDEPAEGSAGPATAAVPYAVVYADEHLLVVDKPAGVVVHPGAGHAGGTLAQALAAAEGAAGGDDPTRPGIVHRLDRDTSGLLLVARSDDAHALLSARIRDRAVAREYLALVEGRPAARTGTIDAPLGRDPRAPERRSVRGRGAREARTHFEVLESLPADSLVSVRLETGRMHQIRVHLAAIGLPVSGDPTYGVAGDLGLERQFLHAARIAFEHPFTGVVVDVDSPLPDDLARALELARER